MKITKKENMANKRRIRALERLEYQLKLGVKPMKNDSTVLSDKDVKRIEKEIEILKSKIIY